MEGQALPRPTAAGWWWATLDIESNGYWCLFNVWKKDGRWVATSSTAEGCPVRYRRVDAYIREEWRWWVGPLTPPVSPNEKGYLHAEKLKVLSPLDA